MELGIINKGISKPDLQPIVLVDKNDIPELENTSELPKIVGRCLRSISPPKLIPETTIEKDSYYQSISFSQAKVLSRREKVRIPHEIQVGGHLENGAVQGSPYRQTFREEWLKDPDLSPWIQKYPNDTHRGCFGRCKYKIYGKILILTFACAQTT